MPSLISKQYQNAMQEFGSRLNMKDESHHEDMTALRRELESARQRIVDLIKEKTDLENEMANFQLKMRELKESHSIKEKGLKQLEIEKEAVEVNLEKTEAKLE